MVTDSISARYAEALFALAKSEDRLEEAARELAELGELIRQHADLQQFLQNPGVGVADKLSVLEPLRRGGWSNDVRAFVQVVLSLGRVEYLTAMAEAFQDLVDAERGLLRVRVRTVHPLPESLKARLKHRLEQMEHRTIEMVEETDPSLLGGIQVYLDGRVLDGSLKTKLAELKQRLKSVRVY